MHNGQFNTATLSFFTMPFSILSRYLLRETIITLVAVLAVLLLILLGGVFAQLLGKVVAGKLSATVLFPLLVVGTLKSLTILLAVALFLATLVTLGRMYKDNEMTALRAGGVGYSRILRPLLILAIVVALLLAGLAFWVQPWSRVVSEQLRTQSAQILDIAGITPGRFIRIPGGEQVVFAESLNSQEKKLENVFLFREVEGKTQIVAAESAQQLQKSTNGERILELGQGELFEIFTENSGYSLGQFERQGLRLPEAKAISHEQTLRGMPTASLLKSDGIAEKTELHWRLSYPVSVLVLVLLAIPLSYTTPRKGQFAKLTVAVLIYVLYINLLGLGRTWMIEGQSPVWLGLWWAHGLVLLLAFVLFVKQLGWRGLFNLDSAVDRFIGGAGD